jgi:hypothetical protein
MKRSVALCVGVLLLGTVSAWAEVEVSFGDSSVQAEGLTSGGTAVVFAVARTRDGWLRRVSQFALLVEADAGGSASVELPEAVPPISIWAVADLATGEFGVGFPEGMEGLPLLEDDGSPMTVGQVVSGRILAGVAEADILVVRPGVGAWRLHVGDGGLSDEDGSPNGALQVQFANMTPMIDGSGPLHGVRSADSIVLIDPRRMAYLAERVGG